MGVGWGKMCAGEWLRGIWYYEADACMEEGDDVNMRGISLRDGEI